jgi:hypothetical protein
MCQQGREKRSWSELPSLTLLLRTSLPGCAARRMNEEVDLEIVCLGVDKLFSSSILSDFVVFLDFVRDKSDFIFSSQLTEKFFVCF